MNFKKHLFPVALCLTSIAFAGCGQGKNTNMRAQETGIPVSTAKLNNFDAALGIDPNADMNTKEKIVEWLKTPPASFNPANPAYDQVKNAVAAQLIANAPFTQALKVLSITPFNPNKNKDISLVKNVKEEKFISIPYLERDKTQAGDLSGINTDSGIDANGRFKIYPTVNGKIKTDLKAAEGTVYLVKYELGMTGEVAPKDAQTTQLALVTIPDAAKTTPVPLMLFAHGGDAGLSFREMATLLQGNLGKFIVAAPVYPGEPICSYHFDVLANNKRSCVDRNNNPVADAVSAIGEKSPMKWDVNGLLGLHNAIQKLATTPDVFVSGDNANPFIDKVTKASIIATQSNDHSFLQTIAVADSRGGGTLMAAIGREGLLSASNGSKIPHISAAAFYYSPSSFLVGQFRFLTLMMLNNSVPAAQQTLPMVPEMTHYFDAYRTAPLGSDKAELNDLVTFLASSDITFLAPYLSIAVQNYTNNNDNITQRMPGSLLFLHGTQDKVVPFTESFIAQSAMDTVFSSVFSQMKDQGNPLIQMFVAPVGSQMFSFQPAASYYKVPAGVDKCGTTADIAYPGNYNPKLNTCFDGSSNSDHGLDSAFLTSHVENYELQSVNVNKDGSATEELQNELLFGVDPNDSKYSYAFNPDVVNNFFLLQLDNLNKGLSFSDRFNLASSCDFGANFSGQCYSYGLQAPSEKVPLYYRSLTQDSINSNYSPAVNGTWDEDAQESPMTPTDLLTAWLGTINSSKGVFVNFAAPAEKNLVSKN